MNIRTRLIASFSVSQTAVLDQSHSVSQTPVWETFLPLLECTDWVSACIDIVDALQRKSSHPVSQTPVWETFLPLLECTDWAWLPMQFSVDVAGD